MCVHYQLDSCAYFACLDIIYTAHFALAALYTICFQHTAFIVDTSLGYIAVISHFHLHPREMKLLVFMTCCMYAVTDVLHTIHAIMNAIAYRLWGVIHILCMPGCHFCPGNLRLFCDVIICVYMHHVSLT